VWMSEPRGGAAHPQGRRVVARVTPAAESRTDAGGGARQRGLLGRHGGFHRASEGGAGSASLEWRCARLPHSFVGRVWEAQARGLVRDLLGFVGRIDAMRPYAFMFTEQGVAMFSSVLGSGVPSPSTSRSRAPS
jgi:hypothetical protein